MPRKTLPRTRVAAHVHVQNPEAWRRDERLRRLGYRDYDDYLDSRAWASKRAQFYAEKRGECCAICGIAGRLVLHHRTYERVGEEEMDDLAALCASCHELLHGLRRAGYTSTLDPEAVLALKGQAHYERRVLSEDRERVRRDANRRARSLGNRVRALMQDAHASGVDIEAELASIETAVEAARSKLSP